MVPDRPADAPSSELFLSESLSSLLFRSRFLGGVSEDSNESSEVELLAVEVRFEEANSSVSLITAAVASERDALTRDNSSSVVLSSLVACVCTREDSKIWSASA